MAVLERIDDLTDPRLRDYTDLREVQLRLQHEEAAGVFIAEGEKVVRRALETGHRARSFLMAPRWLDGLADVLDASDAPCFVLDEERIEQVTGFHVHRGALAAVRRPEPADAATLLEADLRSKRRVARAAQAFITIDSNNDQVRSRAAAPCR